MVRSSDRSRNGTLVLLIKRQSVVKNMRRCLPLGVDGSDAPCWLSQLWVWHWLALFHLSSAQSLDVGGVLLDVAEADVKACGSVMNITSRGAMAVLVQTQWFARILLRIFLSVFICL